MLEIDDISVHYGKAIALRNVSSRVKKGELVTLLGSNGAGKSTLLNTISGLIHPSEGKIILDGQEIQKLAPHVIVKKGVCQVPERREIFQDLTVYENLWMGAYLRKDSKEIMRDMEFVFRIFPVLKERRSQVAGTLSGGESQMLAISRALLSNPRLLMLDEPSLGLAPLLRDTIFDVIEQIYREKGITILLVEQNAQWSLKISTRAYLLENGEISLTGTGEELLKNEYVKKSYLGFGGKT